MVVTSLSTLFFALLLSVAAHPVERKVSLARLPFVRRVSHNPVKQDQLRVNGIFKAPKGLSNRAVINSQAENRAISYIASVGVGSPATNCKWLQKLVVDKNFLTGSIFTDDLIIDTGRWVGYVRLPQVRLKWFFIVRTPGLELVQPITRQAQAGRHPTLW